MVNLTINGKEIQAVEGTTILEAAKNAGIVIPTLCYFKDLNEIGACRVCMVEVEGIETQLFAACKTYVEEGMIVYTDSTRARKVRRDNIRLILSQHDCHCPTCARSGNCSLQTLANQLNILDHPYKAEYQKEITWDLTAPLIKNAAKCIKCMRCIQVCDKIQSLNVWDLANTGSRTCVDVRDNLTIREVDCSFCGQCITHCPVGALGARDDTDKVLEYIDDPDYVTVVQVAPAVRTAWAEMFGIEREKATPKRMAAALRQLGFDYVFDTNFAADLTIMEEASEFVERFTHQDKYKWPMFTSCCPGWVRFIKSQFPAFVDNVSTSKSPQQMFGAIAKSYFAQRIGIDPHKIRCISVMPCVAKKSECAIPIMNDACGDPDVDIVITTREFD
ncbi:MAG: 2Fe-2S iron-sulfur cluster-binding protein, partial [Acidaminococcaceae bacterium]|nr:2Fe-2S iron-sulfur cluster-binding protein [Acidaminococcaceae bacterium]